MYAAESQQALQLTNLYAAGGYNALRRMKNCMIENLFLTQAERRASPALRSPATWFWGDRPRMHYGRELPTRRRAGREQP